jgi:hypothetical protein
MTSSLIERSVAVIFLLLLAFPASAGSELHLSFSAIQKILAAQTLTEEGRLYLKANRSERCNFAYLNDPQVGEEGGRLKVSARFTGRAARNIFGFCIGPGDSFPLSFTAVPYYENGAIRLQDVHVTIQGEVSYYRREVQSTLMASLAKEFRYGLREDARKMLEEKRPDAAYSQSMTGFQVNSVRVTASDIVLSLDFTLLIQ